MPCFKGLAVSIHTPDGPIAEHSVQKQIRAHRITSYIPVPKPRISTAGTAEQSTFAISITLLTPGLSVPYSTPKATPENPYPRAQIVGHGPRSGSATGAAQPYAPLTTSENETIAAYIYFDGRNKEEVATLLRRGEETWVNSRWVGVPDSEGGGLAEREFLFKEVGLERWLNGLDLAGSKDAAEKTQRRKDRLEKKRRKREIKKEDDDEDDAANPSKWIKKVKPKKEDILRYGDGDAPLEKLSDEDQSSDDAESDSDDDDPLPESAGQIKVALFRVLASGEIKKGEYSPQFDAHDDDEDQMRDENGDGEEIDHATSFAKPKTLDPKSISTQTVTGIDPPDKPYAVFTFLYRGEKQLQKMGILKPKKAPATDKDAKRKSVQETVKSLGVLKAGAAERFTNFRDRAANGKKKADDDDMSDEDEDERSAREKKEDDDEDIAAPSKLLDPEDAQRTEELKSGVQKMRLKRQHSFEPPALTPDPSMVPSGSASPTKDGNSSTPPNTSSGADFSATPLLSSTAYNPLTDLKADANLDKSMIGSPMKKARASLSTEEDSVRKARAEALAKGLGFGFGTDTESSTDSAAPAIVFGGSLGSSSVDKDKPPTSGDAGMDEEL